MNFFLGSAKWGTSRPLRQLFGRAIMTPELLVTYVSQQDEEFLRGLVPEGKYDNEQNESLVFPAAGDGADGDAAAENAGGAPAASTTSATSRADGAAGKERNAFSFVPQDDGLTVDKSWFAGGGVGSFAERSGAAQARQPTGIAAAVARAAKATEAEHKKAKPTSTTPTSPLSEKYKKTLKSIQRHPSRIYSFAIDQWEEKVARVCADYTGFPQTAFLPSSDVKVPHALHARGARRRARLRQ